jgi:hypothetical protein
MPGTSGMAIPTSRFVHEVGLRAIDTRLSQKARWERQQTPVRRAFPFEDEPMASKTKHLFISLWCVTALTLSGSAATAQAPAPANGRVPAPNPNRIQQNNAWQQYYLQQSLLQQYGLQLAVQQQNAWLYAGQVQQQYNVLSTVQQLQQQNALLFSLLQQQAALQQLQPQPPGLGQQPGFQWLFPR